MDERQRLVEGDVYYFDSGACAAATQVDIRRQAVDQLVPSASGFLIWEEPPMVLSGGIPIRAATWGLSYDGGTWISWWSDTFEAVRLRGLPAQVLGINGPLTFHEEVHLSPDSWPFQVSDLNSPVYGMFHGLFAAWTAIDTKAVDESELAPLPAVKKRARRQLQVDVKPVRCFRAAEAGGAPTSSQTITRRVLAGLLEDRPYSGELPAELAPWHCYVKDSGHCLLVVLDPVGEDGYRPSAGGNARIENAFVPVPVKAVLRAGYQISEDGYIHTPVRFDASLGVLTDPEDDEF